MKLQKSLSLSIAVLLMLCIVAACGGSPAPAAPTGAFSEKDLGVEIGGKVYYLREDSAALLAARRRSPFPRCLPLCRPVCHSSRRGGIPAPAGAQKRRVAAVTQSSKMGAWHPI